MNIALNPEPAPSPRAHDVSRILHSLLGHWVGTYRLFDPESGKMIEGPAEVTFSTMTIPNVIVLDASSWRGERVPVHAITVMVARADGETIRQMVFQEWGAKVQDKIVLDYNYKSEAEWTMKMLEAQEESGGPDFETVEYELKNGVYTNLKRRDFEGKVIPPREYESLGIFTRTK